MIIGLQGYAGAGKSTVADYLATKHGFARRHIKQPIANMVTALLLEAIPGISSEDLHRYLDGDLKREPIPALDGRSSTELQQFIGTEFGRDYVDPDLWLGIWHRWAAVQPGNVVQESVRFANEGALCNQVWEVRRPGYEALNGHASEALPVEWPNVVLHNTGDMQNLYDQIDRLLE